MGNTNTTSTNTNQYDQAEGGNASEMVSIATSGGNDAMPNLTSPAMTTNPSENEQVLQTIWKNENDEVDDDHKNNDLYETDAPVAFANGMDLEPNEANTEGNNAPGTTSTYVDEQDDVQEEEEIESDEELMNDERYAKVKSFFENEVLVVHSLRKRYFKLCIRNGYDTLEKLKGASRLDLMDIGIDRLDVGTMMIKIRMIKLEKY